MRSIADGGVGDLAELIALPRGRLRRLLRDHTSVPLLRTGRPGLMNLVLLCGHHHRVVHHHGWDVDIGPDGHPQFHPPPWIDPHQIPRPAWRPPDLTTHN